MPIVSYTLDSTPLAPGYGTSDVLRMLDQDGNEYMQNFYAPVGFDTQAKIDASIEGLDQQLIALELEQLVGVS